MSSNQEKKAVRTRNPEKYEYAYLLFMQNVPQQDICTRVGVSYPTLKTWKDSGGWDSKRAARTISLDDLLQKALKRVSEILENNENFSADAFAKAVKQLKELKTANTVDDDIYCFMAFQDFLIQERAYNKDLTDAFIKQVTKFQDRFIQFRLGHGQLAGK